MNIKKALTILSSLVITAGVVFGTSTADAAVNDPNPTDFHIITADGSVRDLTVQGINENVTSQGVYYVTYRFSYPSRNVEVRFPIKTEAHRCDGARGNTSGPYAGIACVDSAAYIDNRYVALDSSNNYTQDITFSISQPSQKVCGAFQTDVFAPSSNNQFITGSLYMTGVDCNQASPSPSPSVTPTPKPSMSPSPKPSMSPSPKPSKSPKPSPSVSPSPSVMPSPSASASTIQCPVGKVSKVVNSTVICVSQNQNQNQNQTQNNDQNQNVNQNVTANGGSSSSSSSSSSSVNLTINNPTPTPAASTTTTTVVYTQTVPQVVAQTKGDVTELPKTGLPLAALALGGLVPGGVVFKRFGKKNVEESANDIWVERQLNS